MITNASESICLLAQAIKKRGESLCSLSELLLQVITWACCIETNASFSCAWIATESKTKQVAGKDAQPAAGQQHQADAEK